MGNYYRVVLGKKSVYAERCFAASFIGVDFGIAVDLTGRLPEEQPLQTGGASGRCSIPRRSAGSLAVFNN
jgi:hypothetical protein